jgi:hypothetical protein
LIRGGYRVKPPDILFEKIRSMGVPIQTEAVRWGMKWEWSTFLDDRLEGEKVDGVERARKALRSLGRGIGTTRVRKVKVR